MIVIVHVEFEFTYNDITVEHISLYPTEVGAIVQSKIRLLFGLGVFLIYRGI